MYRIVLLISFFVIVRCAPSPFYTRSFVRTPTSSVEQYLIMPDKNDPYKVPMSQVHEINEFKFPKGQMLYHNPGSQEMLHEMREDSPMWQQVMDAMKQKSAESSMNKMEMKSADDALESEMMENVDAMGSKISQRETRLMTEAIMRDNNNAEMIDKPIITDDNMNAKMTQDDAVRAELMSIMMEESMTEAMKQKAADLLEATEPQFDQKIMTELLEEQKINDDQLAIMEMMRNLKVVTEATPTNIESQRDAKAMNIDQKSEEVPTILDVKMAALNVMEMLKSIEATSQKPSEVNDSEMQQSLSLRVLAENEQESPPEKPKSMVEIMQEILKINEASLNVLEMMKFIEQTTTVAPAVKEEVERITESFPEVKCNQTEPAMSSDVMQRLVELLSNIEGATNTEITSTEVMTTEDQLSNTSREPKMMELEINDAQGENNMEIRMVEVSTDSEVPERITSTTSSTTSEAIVIKSESTTELPTNDENTAGTAEISSRDNGNESDSPSEQESMEQAVNARQGRVNNSPTLFLHNNRFYVVSGAPEFYANFDAYQRPRTPIFSLQELQPIRPMEKNVRVQKVEPFRIYVGDENDDESARELEALKLDDNERDIEIESMKSTVVEVKKPEQALSDRELSEDSSVALASPDAIAIAGNGGVAKVRPQGIAVTNDRGLSVASPQGTAIAGDFNVDDLKKKRVQLRRLRKIRKL